MMNNPNIQNHGGGQTGNIHQNNKNANFADDFGKSVYDEFGYPNYPKGVPLTFLAQQNFRAAIEPQKQFQEGQMLSKRPISSISTLGSPSPGASSQMFVQTALPNAEPQTYSPTDVYSEMQINENQDLEGSESPDLCEAGQKRLSAFERLGPLTQTKKPKLTINLSLNKDQAVREVVGEMEHPDKIPFHEREDVVNSKDETVVKYLPLWPWKKQVMVRKTVAFRQSKSVMMMEKEQIEEAYLKDGAFIMVMVRRYPPTWTKEDVLDVLLEQLKGKSFIPCFIEFSKEQCRFFVIRARHALLHIHTLSFAVHHEEVEMRLSISQVGLTLRQLDFVPRLVLRKRLALVYDGEQRLDLSAFTLGKDISHFIYFPLNRVYNQRELVQLQTDVIWELLTELDLSNNRIKTIEGFSLATVTPKLKILNLSHNCIEKITVLLPCRPLMLKKLNLEGNPLCNDYTEPELYVKVLRAIFPSLRELDGIPIQLKGDMPTFHQNYCPEDAVPVVEKFLGTFFPLLDSPEDQRRYMQEMYADDAIMTVTYRDKLRYDHGYKYFRNLLVRSSVLMDDKYEIIEGASAIGKLLKKWPLTRHDPYTFTVDVFYHNEDSTLLKVSGILKTTAETLAEDEPLLAFSRTVLLQTTNGAEYKIKHEMVYWDVPTKQLQDIAFRMPSGLNTVSDLKFEHIPDDSTKDALINAFKQITELDEKPSRRCLETKDWHFKNALEYYMKLLKLDNVDILYKAE